MSAKKKKQGSGLFIEEIHQIIKIKKIPKHVFTVFEIIEKQKNSICHLYITVMPKPNT